MEKLVKLQRAMKIAGAATVLSFAGLILLALNADTIAEGLFAVGFMAGIASYCYGGFGTAIRMAGKIAKWGWFVIPFPYDLVSLPVSFLFAVIALVFAPIIPVRKAYKEKLIELEDELAEADQTVVGIY